MTNHSRLFAAALLLLFLSACGQSGPLYIPGDPSSVQPPPAAPESDLDDEEDDEDLDNP